MHHNDSSAGMISQVDSLHARSWITLNVAMNPIHQVPEKKHVDTSGIYGCSATHMVVSYRLGGFDPYDIFLVPVFQWNPHC